MVICEDTKIDLKGYGISVDAEDAGAGIIALSASRLNTNRIGASIEAADDFLWLMASRTLTFFGYDVLEVNAYHAAGFDYETVNALFRIREERD